MTEEISKTLTISIYTKIAGQSRKPFFFDVLKIQNDFYGRLELLIFNLSLIMWSLRRFNDLKILSQELCDIFFQDLDNSLRELGVSDLSVGRKIKVLAENYFGRLVAYTDSFDAFKKNKKIDVVINKIKKNFKISSDQILACPKFTEYVEKNILYFEKINQEKFKSDSFYFQII